MKNIRPLIWMMEGVGRQLLDWRSSVGFKKIEYKKGRGIVSEIDRRAEMTIRESVWQLLPDHKVWGEEFGRARGDLRREKFVIIDAIDGSTNYLSGNPLFASQIAGVEDGKIAWSIVNLPALGELYYAIAGKGAFCNGKRIHPSERSEFDLAIQCFGIGHTPETYVQLAQRFKKHLYEPRHYGCAGVHLSFMACGRTDIYTAVEAAFYDLAPGLLLCKEAGLSFCDLAGGRYTFDERSLSLVIGNRKFIADYKKKIARR